MSQDNTNTSTSVLSSSEPLLERFDKDVQAVYHQMKVLEIVFENLKGSWLAISLAHKVYKMESEEEV